jgi:hypothetical protein
MRITPHLIRLCVLPVSVRTTAHMSRKKLDGHKKETSFLLGGSGGRFSKHVAQRQVEKTVQPPPRTDLNLVKVPLPPSLPRPLQQPKAMNAATRSAWALLFTYCQRLRWEGILWSHVLLCCAACGHFRAVLSLLHSSHTFVHRAQGQHGLPLWVVMTGQDAECPTPIRTNFQNAAPTLASGATGPGGWALRRPRKHARGRSGALSETASAQVMPEWLQDHVVSPRMRSDFHHQPAPPRPSLSLQKGHDNQHKTVSAPGSLKCSVCCIPVAGRGGRSRGSAVGRRCHIVG